MIALNGCPRTDDRELLRVYYRNLPVIAGARGSHHAPAWNIRSSESLQVFSCLIRGILDTSDESNSIPRFSTIFRVPGAQTKGTGFMAQQGRSPQGTQAAGMVNSTPPTGQVRGVCMVSIYYYPWAGGAEKQAERLGTWLVQQGVPMMMVTRRFDDSPPYEVRNGIHIYRIRTLPTRALASLSFTVFGLLTLLRHRRKFNVIHSHQIYSPTTIGWLAARLLRLPLIVNLHLGGAEGDIRRLLRNPRSGRTRLDTLIRDADAFIAISQEIAQEMRSENVPDEKIHFLVNAVDPGFFAPLSADQKQAMRRKLGLPVDAPIAVFVARLVEIKGAAVLLQAWEKVAAPAHLVIIGTGDLADQLQAQATERLPGRVTFTGRIENVYEYLQAADAWTLPSFGEGLPVSLLEAMSVALPVVTTPVGAIPEIIENGVNGLLIPSGDADALAQALTTALDGSPATLAMGSKARALILAKYSLDAIGRSYLNLYNQVLTDRQR